MPVSPKMKMPLKLNQRNKSKGNEFAERTGEDELDKRSQYNRRTETSRLPKEIKMLKV